MPNHGFMSAMPPQRTTPGNATDKQILTCDASLVALHYRTWLRKNFFIAQATLRAIAIKREAKGNQKGQWASKK